MKWSILLLSLLAQKSAIAYPGMGKLLGELQQQAHQQHERAFPGFPGSTQLLGDLVDLPDSSLSASGAAIKAVLSGGGDALGDQTSAPYDAAGELGSAACAADACCVYKYAMLDMSQMFQDEAGGGCSSLARAAIRLGFHDAGAWSLEQGYEAGNGGADGSVLLSEEEFARSDNLGLEAIAQQMRAWYEQYRGHGATMADLVQLGAMTATVVCPGGPRMRFFVGRQDSSVAAQSGLLPMANTTSVDALLQMFAAKTFSPAGLVALLGAHTVSQQFHEVTSRAGQSQDPTPAEWDGEYYNTTLAAEADVPADVYRFPSDVALASPSASTSNAFRLFASTTGRTVWQTAFAAEYLRVSLLGVYNINNMTECSKVLPASTFHS